MALSASVPFGDRLKALRTASRLTSTKLAHQLKISLPYLSQLESNRAVPSEALARRIARSFNQDEDEFVFTARRGLQEVEKLLRASPRSTTTYVNRAVDFRPSEAGRKPMVRLIAETRETLPVSVSEFDYVAKTCAANSISFPTQPLTLADTFDLVRPAVVAFASKLVQTPVGGKPLFPQIIGTGFVVDTDGIVVTNDHVIEALEKLPPHPVTGASSAMAIICANTERVEEGHALPMFFSEIKAYSRISSFKSHGPYYGEDVPDIGFVQLKVRGLLALELADWPYAQRQGTEVATAGFPLGTDLLVPYGKVSQLTPLLRRGIVSSLLPFPCPHPHGFTLDIMSQGGASGSPVFLTDKPTVVGIVHAGRKDTNLTYAIPSLLIRDALNACTNGAPLDLTDVPTLESLIAKGPRTGELRWDSFVQQVQQVPSSKKG